MPNLSDLKAQLSILRQGWKLIAANTDAERYIRECEENLIVLQIEAESLRIAIKNEIALAKKVTVTKGEKQFVRTEFGWESVRETTINAINEREIRGITYYETEIRRFYATDQQHNPTTGAIPPIDQQAKV